MIRRWIFQLHRWWTRLLLIRCEICGGTGQVVFFTDPITVDVCGACDGRGAL